MNFLRTIVALCGSFTGYRQVCDRKWPATLWYLFRLVALLALALTVAWIPRILATTDRFAEWTDAHCPPFSLRDGKVVTAAPQPVLGGTEQFRIVLDTTGAITQPDTTAPFGLLFNADQFLFWAANTNRPAPAVQTRRQSLAGFPDGAVNGGYVRALLRASLPVGLPLLWIGLTLLGLLGVLAQIALFTVMTGLLERMTPVPLPTGQLANIIAHAITPAAIVLTVYAVLPLRDLNLGLIYLVAYSIFLVGGTTACRAAQSPPVSR